MQQIVYRNCLRDLTINESGNGIGYPPSPLWKIKKPMMIGDCLFPEIWLQGEIETIVKAKLLCVERPYDIDKMAAERWGEGGIRIAVKNFCTLWKTFRFSFAFFIRANMQSLISQLSHIQDRNMFFNLMTTRTLLFIA